ncbi:hypothetical protein GCM10010387_60140 [Streptomyces inusitatus]|uniref:DUF2993 domain-containing protein n=1 Tax=Streptomyces inusitatus TaxID=68221 RepID=A0A918QNL6_9ACTN|nr:DUF2993 domain-containing protein [Streptomyces inusitatus]GGZ58217.1 hypothetical protein GCM10010387_60140 [Streptomyces inusitatus]
MRALRILLIIAVILGIVFTGVDRLAVNIAESQVAEKVKARQGLSVTPEVSIKGFPFLTQVMDKNLDEVDISLSGVTTETVGRIVEITDIKAELTGVRIGSDYSSAVAADAEGSARIAYEDLSKAAPKGASIGWAGAERAAKNQVKLAGPLVDLLKGAGLPIHSGIQTLLGDQKITVYSTVELSESGALRLKTDTLPTLPVSGFEDQLRAAVDHELKIEGMPAGIALDRLEVTESGLKIMGTGKDVALAG